MDPNQLQAWLALFAAAEMIGQHVVADVKALAHKTLTPEENQQVLAVWEDNERRSAANAGLTD
jgi:hypothetical protein